LLVGPSGLGIAGETFARPKRAENIPGAFARPHLNQVAASLVLLLDDVLDIGTSACEWRRVFRKAGAQAVWVRNAARRWTKHAIDFKAEPEEEFAVQAQ